MQHTVMGHEPETIHTTTHTQYMEDTNTHTLRTCKTYERHTQLQTQDTWRDSQDEHTHTQ